MVNLGNDTWKYSLYFLGSFLTEGERVYSITTESGHLYLLIMGDGSTDIQGAMEGTLHTLLDALVDNEAIEDICGFTSKKQEGQDEENAIYIDLDYTFNERIAEIRPTEMTYAKSAVYGAYLAEFLKQEDPVALVGMFGVPGRPFDVLKAMDFDSFVDSSYKDARYVRGLLSNGQDRLFGIYLEDAHPERLSYNDARDFAERLVREGKVESFTNEEGTYVYEGWDDSYVRIETFAQMLSELPEYAEIYKK